MAAPHETPARTDALDDFALDLDRKGGANEVSVPDGLEREHVWINARVGVDGSYDAELEDHLPYDAYFALTADETRPRVAPVAGGLLVVVRGVNFNAGAEPEDMVSLRMWLSGTRLVTTQRRRLRAVGDLAEHLRTGQGPDSVGELLLQLVDRLIERMAPLLEELDQHVDELEDRAEVEAPAQVLRELATQRRACIALRRHIAPTRDALSQLAALAPKYLGEGTEWTARELSDQVSRYVDDLDEVRDRAAIAQEFITSRQGDLLNRRMMILSIVAAVFLPLGLVSGLLGMNVGGVPLQDSPDGFLWTCVAVAVLGALQFAALKLVRWF